MEILFDLKNIEVNCMKSNLSIINFDFLQLYKNEHICIVGKSGSGKSTLLKLLNSFITPKNGEVKYLNQSLACLDLPKLRREVLYLSQTPVLAGDTVRDCFTMINELKGFEGEFVEKHILEMFKELSLDGIFLDKLLNDLSGGEKQRVAITRALLFKPKVLLFDEPTTALDKDSVASLINLVRKIDDITFISVSHDESWINQNHRVITLKKGQIVNDRLLRARV